MAYNPPTYGESGEVYTDNVRNSLDAVKSTAELAKSTADGLNASVSAAAQSADQAKEAAAAAYAYSQAPTDGRVATLVNDDASETKAALSASYAAFKVPRVSNGAIAHADFLAAVSDAETSGLDVLVPAGATVTLTANVSLPRPVRLLGLGGATIQSDGTQRYIDVTGGTGTTGSWQHLIAGLTFNGVGIRYGQATTDYGNGATIRDCEMYGSDVAVRYTHNCWSTLIDNCQIHNNTAAGIYFDFATAVSNAGASMKITNTALFNHDAGGTGSGAGAGIYVDGITTDGYQIQCTNVDLEHNIHGLQVVNGGDGVIDLTDCHFEIGYSDYINADSGMIVLSGVWMFGLAAGNVAMFNLSGTAGVLVNSGRIAWDASSLLHRTIGSSALVIDTDSVSMSPVGASTASIGTAATADSTVGLRLRSGATVSKSISNITVGRSAPTTLFSIAPFAADTYELSFRVFLSAAGSGNSLWLLWNPGTGGGGWTADLPATAQSADVTVRWSLGFIFITVTPEGGYPKMVGAAPTHGLSAARSLDAQITGPGSATADIWNRVARVM